MDGQRRPSCLCRPLGGLGPYGYPAEYYQNLQQLCRFCGARKWPSPDRYCIQADDAYWGPTRREEGTGMNFSLLLGLFLAAGVWLVLSSIWTQRRESFADRIAPQLRAAELKKNRPDTPYSTLPEGVYGASAALLAPWVEKVYRGLGRASFDKTPYPVRWASDGC